MINAILFSLLFNVNVRNAQSTYTYLPLYAERDKSIVYSNKTNSWLFV